MQGLGELNEVVEYTTVPADLPEKAHEALGIGGAGRRKHGLHLGWVDVNSLLANKVSEKTATGHRNGALCRVKFIGVCSRTIVGIGIDIPDGGPSC